MPTVIFAFPDTLQRETGISSSGICAVLFSDIKRVSNLGWRSLRLQPLSDACCCHTGI